MDAELRRAARIGHDVAVFQVLTPDEYVLPWTGPTLFEDVETGETVLAGPAVSETYASGLRAFLDRWRDRCAGYGIDYCRVRTDAALDQTLRTYLLRRMRGPRS